MVLLVKGAIIPRLTIISNLYILYNNDLFTRPFNRIRLYRTVRLITRILLIMMFPLVTRVFTAILEPMYWNLIHAFIMQSHKIFASYRGRINMMSICAIKNKTHLNWQKKWPHFDFHWTQRDLTSQRRQQKNVTWRHLIQCWNNVT